MKIKKGKHLVFSTYLDSFNLIVNLHNRWSYINHKTKKNVLYINTNFGNIELVFKGPPKKLTFQYEEKDQLIFLVNE